MQAITWTKAEFQAGVNKKLAALSALRGNPSVATASFDQRLQMANNQVAHAQAQEDFGLRRKAAEQGCTVNYLGDAVARRAAMRAQTVADLKGILLGRFGDAHSYPRKPTGFTAADDSYGATDDSMGASGGDSNPDVTGGAPPKDPVQPQENTDYADQLRLLASNARQASENWVVLDRVAVLHKLLDHAQGLTLTQLAAALLGDQCSPRDTRRLSAMMTREEIRETITRSGRGLPIKLTSQGKRELAQIDVQATSQKNVAERQSRVKTQQDRLQGKLAPRPKK